MIVFFKFKYTFVLLISVVVYHVFSHATTIKSSKREYLYENLISECKKIVPGMTMGEVGLLIKSRNRTTDVSTNNGGHVKYWIAEPSSEIFSSGWICKVIYDKDRIVTSVEEVYKEKKN